jgi:hypothetical protein
MAYDNIARMTVAVFTIECLMHGELHLAIVERCYYIGEKAQLNKRPET